MSSTNEDHRPGTGSRLPSRRTVVAASAWSVPAIALATASPAYASSTDGPVNLPQTLTGVVGGGWSIATNFGANGLPTGYPTAARPTATVVPITVSPARATTVTLTLSGAGFSFFTAATNATFTPTQTVTVTTSSSGIAEVYVAVPPYGKGDTEATITATGNGGTAVSTLATRTGFVYAVGGHTPEGQTGNGASRNAVVWPTPLAIDERLSGVYAGISSYLGITERGTVRTGGYNMFAEVGTGSTELSVLNPIEPLKQDGTPFTDAVRAVVDTCGSEQGLFVVEDSAGDWWATGEQVSNYLAIPGDTTGSRYLTRWEKIGGALPAKPATLSPNRFGDALVWSLVDGTVWFTGYSGSFRNYSNGLPRTTSRGQVAQLMMPDGSPVTGVKRVQQSEDNSVMMLTTDGRLLYSSTQPATITPADYATSGDVQEIAGPPGDVVELWAKHPYDTNGAAYYAKTSDNSLWAIGSNGAARGYLGIGTTTATRTWAKVLVDDVKEMACGAHNLIVLDNSGDVWFAGLYEEGNPGMGTGLPATFPTPVKITTLPPNARTIASTWYDVPYIAY
ncbi:hypothetical protein [Leifsonia shinshuensis]|uniref:IPT/TIG domain-containing protein n=1 Tax=Leifsonia shinshuensis TaxID=150026 RepID=A0A7G6YD96_9MICO|nr:hypothetical protein [Leifsonia shinshuensis]QNE36461.1 hypothetical protein F1C12_15975 [Leifsonia shinshuensis]